MTKPEAVADAFGLADVVTLPSRFNIAPTQDVPVVRLDRETGTRRLDLLRWGLVPTWADDPAIGNRMINARSETVAEKPAYRSAFKARRCLMVADGFYEWAKTPGGKQPFFIRRKDGQLFGFAGLWEHWHRGMEGFDSCAQLTTMPNELMAPIHDRMPVMLRPGDYGLWLDPAAKPADLKDLLAPYPSDEMEAYPVSTLVNRPGNDSPECIRPL